MGFKCSKCKEMLPESSFQSNIVKGRSRTVSSYCRECYSSYRRSIDTVDKRAVNNLKKKIKYQTDEQWRKEFLIKSTKQKANTPQEVKRKYGRDYFNRHKEKEDFKNKYQSSHVKWARKQSDDLTDNYIIGNLIQQGFTKENIPQEIIDLNRIIIKNKRLCRISKNYVRV